jgi:hypothetical protein
MIGISWICIDVLTNQVYDIRESVPDTQGTNSWFTSSVVFDDAKIRVVSLLFKNGTPVFH